MIHDLLTLKKITNFSLTGRKSNVFSWFPDYSWIIITCRQCYRHLGWKFVADKNLIPSHFFGISRTSIKLSIDNNDGDEDWRPLI